MIDKKEILMWPDDKKGVIIAAILSRKRASIGFLFRQRMRSVMLAPFLFGVNWYLFESLRIHSGDVPDWYVFIVDWVPSITLWCFGLCTVAFTLIMVLSWLKDRKAAIADSIKAKSIGVDMDYIDDDWVFDKLMMPIIRRKGIEMPDGTFLRADD